MAASFHYRAAAWLACLLALGANAAHAQSPASRPAENDEVPARFVSSTTAQPPVRAPALSTPPATTATPQSRAALNRLASAPEMFGDYFQTGGDFNYGPADVSGSLGDAGSFSVPVAGGAGPVKIGENNRALPTDRITFTYSHFHNALQFTEAVPFTPAATQQFPLDRYTLGVEKTFLDGTWSCELRLPLQSDFQFQGISVSGAGGNVGNLALILKHLLYIDQDLSVVAGLGLDTPTGSNFVVNDTAGFTTNQLVFQNDAFYLLPYVGALWNGDGPHFINAFLQLDLATGGNRIDTRELGGPTTTLGRFNQQNLLFIDLGYGYWLYQNPQNDGLNTLAAILELHYTSSIQDTDQVTGRAGTRMVDFMNNSNRFDILNLTAGFQAQFNALTFVRVACVVPLGARDDQRFFDNEFQVQVNRRF